MPVTTTTGFSFDISLVSIGALVLLTAVVTDSSPAVPIVVQLLQRPLARPCWRHVRRSTWHHSARPAGVQSKLRSVSALNEFVYLSIRSFMRSAFNLL